MASKVSDLINKLKREIPELENNPLLDEIEMAAHEESPDDQTADQGQDEGSPDEVAQDQGEMNYDDMLGPDQSAEDQTPPAPAPKKKFSAFKK